VASGQVAKLLARGGTRDERYGYCYKAYRRKPGGTDFESKPSAYLNLLLPKTCYPLDPGKKNDGVYGSHACCGHFLSIRMKRNGVAGWPQQGN